MPYRPFVRRSLTVHKFTISPSACILTALTILLLPLRWIICVILAAAFHEWCHYIAVKLCGGRVETLSVGNRGAVLYADDMSALKTLICTLAGPMGSLFLVLFIRWIPRIALCAMVQGLYNLIPIYPLDGGRAIRCIWYSLKNRP